MEVQIQGPRKRRRKRRILLFARLIIVFSRFRNNQIPFKAFQMFFPLHPVQISWFLWPAIVSWPEDRSGWMLACLLACLAGWLVGSSNVQLMSFFSSSPSVVFASWGPKGGCWRDNKVPDCIFTSKTYNLLSSPSNSGWYQFLGGSEISFSSSWRVFRRLAFFTLLRYNPGVLT